MEGIAERIGSVKKNNLSSGQRIDLTCILNNKFPSRYTRESRCGFTELCFFS